MTAAPIKSAEDARRFALAGKARVTFVSTRTGTRFTYRITESKDGAVHFVSLLNGSDNESDYVYLGVIGTGDTFRLTAKSRFPDAPATRAFSWAWGVLQGDTIPESLEVWHEGRCGRCARPLTVPESIASGFGPECIGRIVCEAA